LPWSPLAGGLLSGKFDLTGVSKKGPEGTRRASFDFPPVDMSRAERVLTVLRTVAQATGASVARVALAWVLTRPFVTSVIIGAKSRDQLKDNLAATELKLSDDQVQSLDLVSALPSEYPGWMVDWQNRDPRVKA
jgi:aryl-alcohol dehydrogenase-like predicted oxidoreductase